jgi:hypothetical protein
MGGYQVKVNFGTRGPFWVGKLFRFDNGGFHHGEYVGKVCSTLCSLCMPQLQWN